MIRLLPLLLLAGCATSRGGCTRMLRADLLFGSSTPSGQVTPAEFSAFLDRSVTPRFPAGLTVLDGDGRWQRQDGRLTEEPSKDLLIVASPGAATVAKLDAIRADYAATFQQRSVGLLLSPTCAAF